MYIEMYTNSLVLLAQTTDGQELNILFEWGRMIIPIGSIVMFWQSNAKDTVEKYHLQGWDLEVESTMGLSGSLIMVTSHRVHIGWTYFLRATDNFQVDDTSRICSYPSSTYSMCSLNFKSKVFFEFQKYSLMGDDAGVTLDYAMTGWCNAFGIVDGAHLRRGWMR
jgi:hypothetical protein